MPFGLAPGPRNFSAITRLLVHRFRSRNITVCNYIDDFIFFASSYEEAVRLRDEVLADFALFGLVLNRNKATLDPSQTVRYLGYMFHSTPEPALSTPASKLEKIEKQLKSLLSTVSQKPRHRFQGRTIASIIGKIGALRYALPPARLMTRELLAVLEKLPGSFQSSYDRSTRRTTRSYVRDYDAKVTLTPAAVGELYFWRYG